MLQAAPICTGDRSLAELKTGDLAVRNKGGLYRIVGRRSRMSKIAGLRIGHDALEQTLALKGIQAGVFGDDHTIVAVYTSTHAEDAVRKTLIEASGLTAMHVAVSRQDKLPRLASGKIDYPQLKAGHEDRRFRRTENVRDVFREAFFPQGTADEDTFVSLGGDSLRYVQLSLNLERILNHLPEGWENRPIAELATMQQAKTRMQSLGTDLVIRTLAILLVVIQHATLWPVPGGAAAMVMLIGYSLARFQSSNLFSGHAARVFRPVMSVLVPYYLIIALYGLAWGKVPWGSVFLVGNFGLADPSERTMLPFLYWFVEAYVQMVVIWAGLFSHSSHAQGWRKKPILLWDINSCGGSDVAFRRTGDLASGRQAGLYSAMDFLSDGLRLAGLFCRQCFEEVTRACCRSGHFSSGCLLRRKLGRFLGEVHAAVCLSWCFAVRPAHANATVGRPVRAPDLSRKLLHLFVPQVRPGTGIGSAGSEIALAGIHRCVDHRRHRSRTACP